MNEEIVKARIAAHIRDAKSANSWEGVTGALRSALGQINRLNPGAFRLQMVSMLFGNLNHFRSNAVKAKYA